ncbi:MAG: hypothetical protein ABSG02_18735 [Terriglobales bacterium]
MHTTLQRCPRSSVEQFGQIEAASVFIFAGAMRLGLIAGSAAAAVCGVADGCDEFLVVPGELMWGVVAQIEAARELLSEELVGSQ